MILGFNLLGYLAREERLNNQKTSCQNLVLRKRDTQSVWQGLLPDNQRAERRVVSSVPFWAVESAQHPHGLFSETL